MSVMPPRAVLVSRASDLEELLVRHGTLGQAKFFLKSRGQSMDRLVDQHEAQSKCYQQVRAALPEHWRQAEVKRDELSRFLFSDRDVVVAIGQDGLIANLAKYAHGHPVMGINPEPERIAGLLVNYRAEETADLLRQVESRSCRIEQRTMVEARLDDGQRLLALNEIFVGQASHQSSRYEIRYGEAVENQSSSGVIITSGTGTTGWARSIIQATGSSISLDPADPRLAFFCREPWPSPTTGTGLQHGYIDEGRVLALVSAMNEGGVIFADGIETDRLAFNWGMTVTLGVARETLNLVVRS